MTSIHAPKRFVHSLLAAALAVAACAALAQKPEGVGQGKGKNKHQTATQPAPAASQPVAAVPVATTGLPKAYLSDAQRKAIQDHYASQQQRSGRCPPGLAKKNNGCLPPGQAKKWAMGKPLPADVAHQPVPDAVLKKIGMVQKGIEIVRILNDVVVLQKGSRTVLDAVDILGQH